jgi:tetratricopeptide (TPR) repeat protein
MLWKSVDKIDLVIDDCRDLDFIRALSSDIKKNTPAKSIVFSSRTTTKIDDQVTITVPPMSPSEIVQVIPDLDEGSLDEKTIKKIFQSTLGNPLEARFYSADSGKKSALEDFENTYWDNFDTQSKEILTYVALSPIPLETDGLLELTQIGSACSLFTIIERLKSFLKDEALGYSIIHESIKDAILKISEKSVHRNAYYSKSLSSMLIDRDDVVNGYLVLNKADQKAALELAPRAAFTSIRNGNIQIALDILQKKMASEKKAERMEDALITFLGIIELSVQSGPVEDAIKDAEKAVQWADTIGDKSLVLIAREIQATTLARGTLQPNAIEVLRELRQIHEDNGDLWTRGRIDLEIGAVYINMKRLEDAEEPTRNAIKSFEDADDKYGCSLAKRNLISILAGLRPDDKEVSDLLSNLESITQTNNNERERAWFCNVMVRKLRRSGELRSAEKYGREAVKIGEKLGDTHLVALNQICLGNVYRDQKDYDKAYTEYFLASKAAQDIGDRAIEASTSNLISGLHNRMGNSDLAIYYANHAVSLVQGTLATIELSDSLEELGDAYSSNNEPMEAAKAYIDAAAALKDSNNPEEVARLASCGLFLFVKEKQIDSYLSSIDQVWDLNLGDEDNHTTRYRLYARFLEILPNLPQTKIIDVLGLHFRLLFEGLSKLESRYLFSILSRDIVARDSSSKEVWQLLFPILPLLTSATNSSISNFEIVTLADSLHKNIDGISFKPRVDGSSNWTVELSGKNPVSFTIAQIDNENDSAICAMILALFLKGFEKDIEYQFASDEGFFCNEISIQICSASELTGTTEEMIRPALRDAPCTVSSLSDISDLETPTIIFCREDIAESWEAGTGKGSSIQLLIGLTLTEIAYRLLGGEVERETLRPKVLEILRKTVS